MAFRTTTTSVYLRHRRPDGAADHGAQGRQHAAGLVGVPPRVVHEAGVRAARVRVQVQRDALQIRHRQALQLQRGLEQVHDLRMQVFCTSSCLHAADIHKERT
jgi:hypothetical protein